MSNSGTATLKSFDVRSSFLYEGVMGHSSTRRQQEAGRGGGPGCGAKVRNRGQWGTARREDSRGGKQRRRAGLWGERARPVQ